MTQSQIDAIICADRENCNDVAVHIHYNGNDEIIGISKSDIPYDGYSGILTDTCYVGEPSAYTHWCYAYVSEEAWDELKKLR